MRYLLSILLLFAISVNAQQLRVGTSVKYAQNPFGSKYNGTGNYIEIVGDSINSIFCGTSFEGTSFVFKRQTKETLQFRFKFQLKRLASTTTRFSYGLILWKNGARVQLPAVGQFEAVTLTFARWTSENYNVGGTGGLGVKTLTKNIDFSQLPAYDSLEVHVSLQNTAFLSYNGTPFYTFHKNDLSLTPLKNESGITKYNYSQIDFDTDLYLPDTLFVPQNATLDIYNNNVAYIPLGKDALITYDWSASEIGVNQDSVFKIKTATLGNYAINLKVKDLNGLIIDEVSSVVKIEPKAVIDSVKINPIGNSLTGGGWQYQYLTIRDSIDVGVVDNIGTQGTTIKHEGHSGWMYATYFLGISPFMFDGVFDYQKYLDTNALKTPDVIRLSLGINECFQELGDDVIVNSTRMIDSLLVQSDAEILISMPTTGQTSLTAWFISYPTKTAEDYENYIKCTRSVGQQINERFFNGKYNPRVNVSYDTYCIDRNNGYTNTVHPNSTGYKQLAKGTAYMINHINQ